VKRLLVVANETVAGKPLIEAVKRHAARSQESVTVLCPVNQPNEGYVVYVDTRRAAAGRRLEKTLQQLRDAGIKAHGFVVESGPVDAVRDELAQNSYDAIIVSTHPQSRSGWLRRNVVEQLRKEVGAIPLEHVVVDLLAEREGEKNVLVVANETILGKPLLDEIGRRAADGTPSFLILAPQGQAETSYEDAEQRLRSALAELRGAGIDVHGQIAHPDPYTAVMQTIRDERVDEIIVSTFPRQRSGWLRRDLIERLKKDTGLSVRHIVVEPVAVGAAA
jgi:nucleotide-binding universal stress UspA family protein